MPAKRPAGTSIGKAEAQVRAATPADAGEIAAVHVTCWREAYVGLLSPRTLGRLSVPHRTSRWNAIIAKAELSVFVAHLPEGSMLGFGCCGPQQVRALSKAGYDGQVLALYVLRGAQRQGVGSALVTAMRGDLSQRGLTGATFSALEGNRSALSFCEALGGTVVGRRQGQCDEQTLTEVVYGWRSLADLLGRDRRASASLV